MAVINPYIHFNGNAEEAFTFYKSVFGGEFANVSRYKDISSEQYPIAEDDLNSIMHIALPIGKSNVIMGSDAMKMMGEVTETDNRYTVAIIAESKAEADTLYNGLSEGGKIEMPLTDTPTGSYFGMFADKFNVQWMVNFDPKFSVQD